MPSRLDYWVRLIGVLSSQTERGEHIRAARTGIIPSVLIELILKKDYVKGMELGELIEKYNYNLLALDGKEIVIDWIRLFDKDFPRSLGSAKAFLKKYGLTEEKRSGPGGRKVLLRVARKEAGRGISIYDFIRTEENSNHYKHYIGELKESLAYPHIIVSEDVRRDYSAYDENKEEHLKVTSIAKLHFSSLNVPYLLVPKPP